MVIIFSIVGGGSYRRSRRRRLIRTSPLVTVHPPQLGLSPAVNTQPPVLSQPAVVPVTATITTVGQPQVQPELKDSDPPPYSTVATSQIAYTTYPEVGPSYYVLVQLYYVLFTG